MFKPTLYSSKMEKRKRKEMWPEVTAKLEKKEGAKSKLHIEVIMKKGKWRWQKGDKKENHSSFSTDYIWIVYITTLSQSRITSSLHSSLPPLLSLLLHSHRSLSLSLCETQKVSASQLFHLWLAIEFSVNFRGYQL